MRPPNHFRRGGPPQPRPFPFFNPELAQSNPRDFHFFPLILLKKQPGFTLAQVQKLLKTCQAGPGRPGPVRPGPPRPGSRGSGGAKRNLGSEKFFQVGFGSVQKTCFGCEELIFSVRKLFPAALPAPPAGSWPWDPLYSFFNDFSNCSYLL